jgi:hypothetical protein
MFEYDSVNVEFLVQMDGDVHLNATIVAKVEEVYDKHPDVE